MKPEEKKEPEKKEEVVAETQELANKVADLTGLLQRLQAEFDNYRKRTNDERKEIKNIHNHLFFEKLIPIIDNFEEALKHPCTDKNYELGMKMIHAALIDVLNNENVIIINPQGEQFTAELHEALDTDTNSEHPDNTITKVLQKGYVLNGRPIRRAKVIVNKRTEAHK